MALNDIIRLRIHCRIHGGEVLNILHFVDDTGISGDGAQDLCNDFRTNMEATMRARASTDTFFEYIEAVKIVPYGEGPRTSIWPSSIAGGVATTTPSATLCEVLTIHSAQIGRRHRGRMFLAGIAPAAMLSGQVTPAQTTRTSAFATALATRYMVAGHPSQFTLGIWSKTIAGPDPPWPTSAFTRATALTVRTIIRNQRRRQVGVGR
jgi:hypothetical protein